MSSATDRGDFLFVVKEFGDGTPWIVAEPRRKTIPVFNDAIWGFDLPEGTTLEKAHEIADYMNHNLKSLAVTLFDTHPMFTRKAS
jgi:hypothetical protein